MASKLKILVVEDDPIHLATFMMYIEEMGYHMSGHTGDSEEVLRLIASTEPDVVLMDIQIDGSKNGIEVAQEIKDKYRLPFIFVTAFKDKGTFEKAQKTDPYAYLAKPVAKENLQFALELAFYKFYSKDLSEKGGEWLEESGLFGGGSFFIKSESKIVKINIAEVLGVEVVGKISIIHTTEKKIKAKVPLNSFEKHLKAPRFVRVHRSFIINKNKIEDIDLGQNKINLGKLEVPIGRSYKPALFDGLELLD